MVLKSRARALAAIVGGAVLLQAPACIAAEKEVRIALSFPNGVVWPYFEMRESPSSLARSSIEQSALAVAVADGDQLRWLKHADIVAAKPHSSIAVVFDNWDLGEALSRFAHGDEVRLG